MHTSSAVLRTNVKESGVTQQQNCPPNFITYYHTTFYIALYIIGLKLP